MPLIDFLGSKRLRELREDQGLSPEALAQEIRSRAMAEGWKRGTVDAYTIRRAERGFVPSLRSRHVLASYFQVRPGEIWNQDGWVRVDAEALT